uniref:Defensin A n=1 Tax=Nilaparvata lugens TaxID=108931 RepID=M9ZV82_NILLU|nr:defensin A [Nilaparvata lugens]
MNSSMTAVLLLVASVMALYVVHVNSLPTGMPVEDDLVLTGDELPAAVGRESAVATGSRAKRATCDLFSFETQWVTPNHAACAAHCIVLGKKGGYCSNTICYCRN